MTSVSMAGEELPVFHDFLGIVGQRCDPARKSQPNLLDTSTASNRKDGGDVAIRASSNSRLEMSSPSVVVSEQQLSCHQVPSGSPQLVNKTGFGKPDEMRIAKRRDVLDCMDYIQQQQKQLRDLETLENSPFLKVSRLGEMKGKYPEAVDISAAMQPPRVALNCQTLHSHAAGKRDHAAMFTLNKWDNAKHVPLNNGMPGQVRSVPPQNFQSEKIGMNNMPPCPPADEGSRTGMKGSSARNVLNSPHISPTVGVSNHNTSSGLPPGRSKSWSQSAAMESMYTTSQQTNTPTSRQLTIFYGGQAHVFDDVPSDKVDAIMTLAGSTGRSWSTTYAPREKSSLPTSGSEGYLSICDMERDKSTTSKSSAMNGITGLALSEPEIHKSVTNSPLGQARRQYDTGS